MKKKNKAFTLIELLAVIVILAIILIIAIPKITNIIEKSRINTFHRDEDILVITCRTYLSNNSDLLPKDINSIKIISYTDLIKLNYLEEILDPKSKEPCFDISRVLVKKVADNKYSYIPALACPNYIGIVGFNLLTNYVDFEKDLDRDGLADGFLFWSSKNDFEPSLLNKTQYIEYEAYKKVALGISEIRPPSIGDKVYVAATYKANRTINLGNAFYLEFANDGIPIIANNSFQTFSDVFSVVNESHKLFLLNSYANTGDIIEIKDLILINLTEIFGSGNEPSKSDIDRMIRQMKIY